MKQTIAVASLLMVCLFNSSIVLADDEAGPGKLEFRGAEKRVEDFEAKVKRMRGQPFKLTHLEEEALRRVWALKEKYPGHTDVEALFQRARACVMAAEGRTVEIDPKMLEYRKNEQRLKAMFYEVASKEWAVFREKIEKTEGALVHAFPAPDQDVVDANELIGRYVILDDFRYPMNEFTDMGRQMVFVGSGVRGYYYVELSNRQWLGAYEAFKRYRRFVNRDVPEAGPWTLVGKISGVEMIIPEAGEEKKTTARWGWTVVPEALWVEGCTLATADSSLELGGSFAGEATMEDIKSEMYTVREIPDDVTPERLTEIFITTIKEKNYRLFLQCIDPERRETRKAEHLILYHWDWHQLRFAEWYCHILVDEAKITTLQGLDTESDDIRLKFLDPEQIAKLKKHEKKLIKAAELRTNAYDEKGRQYGSPKPRFFKKVGDGRWYITNYAQPF